MKIISGDYRVRQRDTVDLTKWPTNVEPVCKSKRHYKDLLEKHVDKLSTLQRLHYASNRYAILLIFQAMDAAGKDGAIRHVMSGVNPQGCQVFSFKHPSATELFHDFLWRTTRDLPERGRIGIFNRSYYEEVLVARVHPEILRNEGLPDSLSLETAVWQDRYRSILDLEAHLHRNGTRIVKFYLHLSKDEQRKRFLDRIDEPEKNWKFSQADVEERKFWKHYMTAYEECVSATSTTDVPWYVVPADDKDNARLIVSQIILDTLEGLSMHYPKTTPERHKELLSIRKQLATWKHNLAGYKRSLPEAFLAALPNALSGLIDEDQPEGRLRSIESKYLAAAAVVALRVTLLLTGGSLITAFGVELDAALRRATARSAVKQL